MAAESLQLPAALVDAVQSQSAVLFLGAGASFGARHPRGASMPRGDSLRDALSDQFLKGELKDKPLATVAEYADAQHLFGAAVVRYI